MLEILMMDARKTTLSCPPCLTEYSPSQLMCRTFRLLVTAALLCSGCSPTQEVHAADTSAPIPSGDRQLTPETWRSIARLLDGLDDISKAAVDPRDGNLRIIGKFTRRLPPLTVDELYAALKHVRTAPALGVSIEPAGLEFGNTDPDALMTVRYIPTTLAGSCLARVFYLSRVQ